RSRQSKREINERIDDPLAGKLVAHQHPRGKQSQHAVDGSRNQRGADAQAIGSQGARASDRFPEMAPARAKSLQESRPERDQNDQAQVENRKAHRKAKSWKNAVLMEGSTHRVPPKLLLLIDLIEDTAVIEVRLLDLAPTAEDFVHREQLDLGEVFSVLLFDLNQTRAIKVLGGNFLACRTIEVFQISLRESAGSALIGYFVNYRVRRLGKNTDRRNGDLELVRAKLLKCEKRLVLPRDQHVANVAFYKRGCG